MEQLLSCFCFHVSCIEKWKGGLGEDISLFLLFSVLVLPWFLACGCFKTVLSGISMTFLFLFLLRLLMKWRFEDRICKQMEAIKKVLTLAILFCLKIYRSLSQGFNDIFNLKMLQVFDEREMEVCRISSIFSLS